MTFDQLMATTPDDMPIQLIKFEVAIISLLKKISDLVPMVMIMESIENDNELIPDEFSWDDSDYNFINYELYLDQIHGINFDTERENITYLLQEAAYYRKIIKFQTTLVEIIQQYFTDKTFKLAHSLDILAYDIWAEDAILVYLSCKQDEVMARYKKAGVNSTRMYEPIEDEIIDKVKINIQNLISDMSKFKSFLERDITDHEIYKEVFK